MFGSKSSIGQKTLFGGVAMTIIQTLLARRVAGRAAGVAARGAGGIPGLLIWMAASYFLNRYLNRRPQSQPVPQRREYASR